VREIILKKPLVRVNDGTDARKSILGADGKAQLYFPSPSQFKEDSDNNAFYGYCDILFPNIIPVKEELEGWHSILWSDQEKIRILRIEDVIQKVSEAYGSIRELSEYLKYDQSETIQWLNGLYRLVNLAERAKLLEEYSVNPNLNGDFKAAIELRRESKDSKTDDQIIALLKGLSPSDDFSQIILHREIKQDFYNYQSISLKNDVGPKFNEILNKKNDAGQYLVLEKNGIESLLMNLLSFCAEGETSDSEK